MMRLYKYAKCSTCDNGADDDYFIDELLLDQLKGGKKQRDEYIKRKGKIHAEGLFLFLLNCGWDWDSDGLLKCPSCLRGKVVVRPQTLTEALAQDARELEDILARVKQRPQYKEDDAPLGYSLVEGRLRYVVQQFRHLQKVWKR